MEIPQYTGLNIGKALTRPSPEGVVSTLERTAQREEEQKRWEYQKQKAEEADYLKLASVKPEYIISSKGREDQATAITDFNNRWAPAIKKGYLTIQEKAKMASERGALESYQTELLEKMGQWKRIDEMVKSNPDKFDIDEWNQTTSDYIETGNFNMTTPPIRPRSLFLALQQMPVQGTAYPVVKEQVQNGVPGTIETVFSGTDEEAKQHVESLIMNFPDIRKGVIKEFQALDPQKKKEILDVNKDNVISTSEAQDINPILKWAKDTYYKTAIKETPGRWARTAITRDKPTAEERAGKIPTKVGNTTVSLSPGQMVGKDIPYGDKVYSKYSFAFGDNKVLYGIPTQNAIKLEGDWPKENVQPGSVNARLVRYDPTRKVFLIETGTGSESADLKSRVLLEVPEANIQGFENIPVTVNGQTMTLGDNRKLLAAAYDEYQSKNPPASTPQTTTPAKATKGRLY